MLLRTFGLIALFFVLGCGAGQALQPVTDEAPPSGEETARQAGDATGDTEILYETSRDSHSPQEAPRPLEEDLGEGPEELDEEPEELGEEPEELNGEDQESDEEDQELDEEDQESDDDDESQTEEEKDRKDNQDLDDNES